MKIINASVEVLSPKCLLQGIEMMELAEMAGRVCYKSDKKGEDEKETARFINKIINNGHHSVLEHITATVKFVCDRGVSHEIVRHRLAAYSQESTRYCNYSQERFGNEITVIKPLFFDEGSDEYAVWENSCKFSEASYFALLKLGCNAQQARSVLPNSLKTEIVVTYNIREWRHFFNLRYLGTTGAPHPQMREVAGMALEKLKNVIPIVFDDFV